MDASLSRLIFLGIALGATLAVGAIMWAQLSLNTPTNDGRVDYDAITSESLCEAVSGTWTNNKCGASTS